MSEKTAILFPGQGSQQVAMGKELAERNSSIMDLWKKAEKYSNLPLREIYWTSNDEVLMANTQSLQPALTVVNISTWLEHYTKFETLAFMGHSLGEFAALAAAKVLAIDEVLELVALRGQLMAQADPNHEGSMAVVLRLEQEEVESVVEEVAKESGKIIRIANYNTPKQFALSGHKEALELFSERLNSKRAKIIPLAVSGAFHSPLMAEANAEFAKALNKCEWNTPIAPIYANVTAEKVLEGHEMHALIKRQMTSSVYWFQAIKAVYKTGIKHFTEIGPKGVLIRMVPHILPADEVICNHYE